MAYLREDSGKSEKIEKGDIQQSKSLPEALALLDDVEQKEAPLFSFGKPSKFTAIHSAIMIRDKECIRKLLHKSHMSSVLKNEKINTSEYQETINQELVLAAGRGDESCIKFLLALGADINCAVDIKWKSDTKCQHGENLNSLGCYSPLALAVIGGNKYEFIESLIETGAKIGTLKHSGMVKKSVNTLLEIIIFLYPAADVIKLLKLLTKPLGKYSKENYEFISDHVISGDLLLLSLCKKKERMSKTANFEELKKHDLTKTVEKIFNIFQQVDSNIKELSSYEVYILGELILAVSSAMRRWPHIFATLIGCKDIQKLLSTIESISKLYQDIDIISDDDKDLNLYVILEEIHFRTKKAFVVMVLFYKTVEVARYGKIEELNELFELGVDINGSIELTPVKIDNEVSLVKRITLMTSALLGAREDSVKLLLEKGVKLPTLEELIPFKEEIADQYSRILSIKPDLDLRYIIGIMQEIGLDIAITKDSTHVEVKISVMRKLNFEKVIPEMIINPNAVTPAKNNAYNASNKSQKSNGLHSDKKKNNFNAK